MPRVANDILMELRNRPALIDALRDLGLSQKTAEHIAEAYPDGRGLEKAGADTLERMGATAAQARRVVAAFGMVRVCDDNCKIASQGQSLSSPSDVVNMLRTAIGREEQEYFAVILLDARQKVVDVLGVAVGTLSEVSVHPRDVFREAVRRGAAGVILAHNHPSGSNKPSEADIALTERMVEVGKMVGIPVLDHLIVTPQSYSSIAQLQQSGSIGHVLNPGVSPQMDAMQR